MPLDDISSGSGKVPNVAQPVSSSSHKDPFVLREYEWAAYRFFKTAVDTLVQVKNPVLRRIVALPAAEIYTSRVTTPDGQMIENPPMRMSLEVVVDVKDIVAGRLEAFIETIDGTAEEGTRTVVPQVADYMRRVIEGSGEAVKVGSGPFDHGALKKFVESVAIYFDDSGMPDLDAWILTTHSLNEAQSAADLLRIHPPRSETEVREWNELMQRKKLEFDDKRPNRKLS